MFDGLLNQLVQGVLQGGLYAMFAVGLSLSVGVMRLVNIAHGDFIVLGSFTLYSICTALGISPFLAMLIILPPAFGLGYLLQTLLFQRIVGKDILPVILVTFGLSIIIQNGLLMGYGPNPRDLNAGALETASLNLGGGVAVGVFPLLTFVSAVALIFALDRFLYRSRTGAKIRAVSDDVEAARLIGLSSRKIYATAMGLVMVTIAISACFMGVRTNFNPASGPSQLLIAFEAVVMGGLGSLWGTLWGGILIGLAQAIGARIALPWEVLSGHLLFLAVLALRPQGLMPKE
ncbi:branched-chain amino acid ABC transporter permease [Acidimangrovimonas sediminis]|uniref:branched-chain amino acid ABC transporter permease n=1 Tax=Acidimangrovimonas sediminis TaxID=2056283 RepID=UPI000C7F9FA9|nr:branched-chain amino acid ABC transporter permease [Acidimangrovimonas sediminis]